MTQQALARAPVPCASLFEGTDISAEGVLLGWVYPQKRCERLDVAA